MCVCVCVCVLTCVRTRTPIVFIRLHVKCAPCHTHTHTHAHTQNSLVLSEQKITGSETYLKYMHLERARDADQRTHEKEERERACERDRESLSSFSCEPSTYLATGWGERRKRLHEHTELDVEHAATVAAEFLQEAKCLGARTYVDCNEKSS